MERILIVGAGGHAQVVADILLRARDAGEPIRPIGYLDDNSELREQMLLDLPVLGGLADRDLIAHDAVLVAIGDNHLRQSLFDQLQQQGARFVAAKHPQAAVAPDASLGIGVVICAGVVVNPGSVVGDNVILNTGCTIDHHCRIGGHAHIAPGAHLGGEVVIGEGTLVGIGATIGPGIRVGSWSVVGAGAAVLVDIPDGVLAYGVPAKAIRAIDAERNP
jgi:sugar O-acyltransferase (sialic acid O-acetyltransferase NeuD family)